MLYSKHYINTPPAVFENLADYLLTVSGKKVYRKKYYYQDRFSDNGFLDN